MNAGRHPTHLSFAGPIEGSPATGPTGTRRG